MKYAKTLLWFSGYIISTLLFCTCRNSPGADEIQFRTVRVEHVTPLISDHPTPCCKMVIEMEEIDDTTLTARRMNHSIMVSAFGTPSSTLTDAIDSFCENYSRQYKKDLSTLYQSDMENGINAAWYDYKFHLFSTHKKGHDDCLCYLIRKVRYEGGAHEYEDIICLNFDTNTGELITLEDRYRPTLYSRLPSILLHKTLEQFNCQSLQELHEKNILRLTEMYIPNNYELGEDGITFIFNAGEIAPHESGAIRLTVPYAEIESFTSQKQ